ncbi:MAG: UvrB/UvrC motif-containing protein [Candidatus Omnitrophota bacterium]
MLCNICNKNQATVHLTEIVDDQMTELHLCDECAKKKSVQMEQQFGLSDLLAGLVDYTKQIGGGQEKTEAATQCSFCGLTYEDFRKIGRLGCSECYGAFSRFLGPLLKRIHGATAHVGKSPVIVSSSKESGAGRAKAAGIGDLKIKLQEAIDREEFEEAARLRDAIKEAEKKRKSKSEEDKPGPKP